MADDTDRYAIPPWDDVHRLAWWMAKRLGRLFKISPYELVGSVCLTYYKCLPSYKPERRVKFTQYWLAACYNNIPDDFLRHEADWRESTRRKREPDHIVYFNAYEMDSLFFRAAPDDDITTDIIGSFPTPLECWLWMCRELKERDKLVLERRFRHGHKLAEIAKDLKITRERVRQLEQFALERVRRRMRTVTQFNELFTTPTES